MLCVNVSDTEEHLYMYAVEDFNKIVVDIEVNDLFWND